MQALESFRMELGTLESISDIPFDLRGASITDSWLKTLRQSTQQFGICIEGSFDTFKLL